MTNSASPKTLGSEFDAFLFATIGRDKNEMVLSVASALARLDLDPWQEAASLARLLQPLAVSRLNGLIAALPGGAPSNFDLGSGTARLVALLPGQHPIRNPAPVTIPLATAVPNYHLIVSLIVSALFMVGAQYVMASREASASPVKGSAVAAKPVPKKLAPSSTP
jgi:hypothetical protein